MTLQELINQLLELQSELGPNEDPVVKIAQQPSWPFEYSIGDVVMTELPETMTRAQFDALSEDEQERANDRADNDELVFIDEGEDMPERVVFIAEGSQLGYLTSGVSKQLGWR